MFRKLATMLPGGAQALVQMHPAELTALMELAWDNRTSNTTFDLGHPDHRSDVPGLSQSLLTPILTSFPGAPSPSSVLASVMSRSVSTQGGFPIDHLIYAYMVENTHIYEIFRRVLSELLHGEKLGVPSPATQLWMRNTEELFYRDPPAFSIITLNSYIRSNLTSTRRNAYQRMFGNDLNHAAQDYKAEAVITADASNKEFFSTFEELLREVWIGIVNANNSTGANPTDDGKIADLATKLHDMLITRRLNGNLSREEFFFVSMMAWFHMTVESNLPVIVDLRSEAASPEQRLFKVAQRAGIPAQGLSKNYFDIADPISRILILIERGTFNQAAAAAGLYKAGGAPPPVPVDDMRTIIHDWSIITGRDMKAGKVAPT